MAFRRVRQAGGTREEAWAEHNRLMDAYFNELRAREGLPPLNRAEILAAARSGQSAPTSPAGSPPAQQVPPTAI